MHSLPLALIRYGAAAGLSGLAVILLVHCTETFGLPPPYLVLLLAPILSCWLGGTRSGLVSTLLATLGGFLFVPLPAVSLFLPLGLFLVEGFLISLLTGRCQDALHRLREHLVVRQRIEEEHRLLASQLERRIEEFETLMEALPAAIWISRDPLGKSIVGNSASYELLHAPTGSNISKTAPETERLQTYQVFVDGREVAGEDLPIQAAMRAGKAVLDAELEIRRDTGERVTIFGNAVPLFDEEGKVRGGLAAFIDVSDRKRMEIELRESERSIRELADAMPQIVWTASADGRWEYCNRRWLEITDMGSGTGSLSGRWLTGVHPEDVEVVRQGWSAAVAAGMDYQQELRVLDRVREEYRWMLARAVPVRERGVVVRWYGTWTDINDQKRTQVALAEADRRKDRFVAMLSHELRDPLAPIANALELLGGLENVDIPVREASEVIGRQVALLTGLINDLLDVFEITQRKVKLRKERFDLVEFLRAVARDHRSNLAANRVSLTLDLPSSAVEIAADRHRLRQVMNNLLKNASQFTNPGNEVVVALKQENEAGQVRIVVRDDGTGIAPEELPRVFEAFTQAEQSLDRRMGGLGLGLALVQGLVQLHGGEVRATSAGPNRGTQVEFTLPLDATPSPASRLPVGTPQARALTLLVIEDNVDTATTLGRFLQRYGHTIAIAHDGATGVRLAKEQRPEVVLCDLGLPELNGFEVCEALRADPETAKIRILAISGYGQEEDRRRCEEVGFDMHLTKPVDPQELVRLLSRLRIDS